MWIVLSNNLKMYILTDGIKIYLRCQVFFSAWHIFTIFNSKSRMEKKNKPKQNPPTYFVNILIGKRKGLRDEDSCHSKHL